MEVVEFIEEKGGIYLRSIFLEQAGMKVPQHVHSEDHATLCAAGKARLYVDGVHECDVEAGHAVEVKAGKLHEFESLEPGTRLVCLWTMEAAMRLKEAGF